VIVTPKRPAKDQTQRHRFARGKGSRLELELVALERQVLAMPRRHLHVQILWLEAAGAPPQVGGRAL